MLNKYGPAQCNYFHTLECKGKNYKISRTSEGLFCHHIQEYTLGQMSNTFYAQKYLFSGKKRLTSLKNRDIILPSMSEENLRLMFNDKMPAFIKVCDEWLQMNTGYSLQSLRVNY